jgi:hypothetical protein
MRLADQKGLFFHIPVGSSINGIVLTFLYLHAEQQADGISSAMLLARSVRQRLK